MACETFAGDGTISMKVHGILLGLVMLLGHSAHAIAATATWSEEMTDEPNLLHPNRWGVCMGVSAAPYDPCDRNQFENSAQNIIDSIVNHGVIGGVWTIPDGVVSNGGVGILDGPLGQSRPSPVAGKRQFTVESRFKMNNDAVDIGTWNYPFALNNDSTGNIPFSFRYGRKTFSGADVVLELHVNDPSGNIISMPSTQVPYDKNWHTVRIIENYTGDQVTGAVGAGGYVDMYLDSVLLTVNPVATHTFNLDAATLGAAGGMVGQVKRNRTFAIAQAITYGPASSFSVDYLRFKDSIVPIGEALNAPVVGTGCGGDVSGLAPGIPDGTTDGADVAFLYNYWGAASPGNLADIYPIGAPDGQIDGGDLGRIYNCWAQADAGLSPVVPEPASVGIVGLGLVGLLAVRRHS